MNLSWTASPGATSYQVERETLATGAWALLGAPSGASYSDTTYGTGGYHYRVSAINGVGTNGPSGEYPISRYVVVKSDAGLTNTPVVPIALNNQGSVVLKDSTNAYFYWAGGTPTPIPLQNVGGLNNSNVVVGTTAPTSSSGSPYITYANQLATWTPSTSPTNIAQASASYLYSPYGVGRTPGIIGDFDYSNVIYATQSILPAANGGDYPHANPVIDDSGNVYAVTAVDFAMTYLIDDPDLGVLTNNATWTEASIFNYSGGSATQIGETTFGNNMGNNPFGVNDAHTYWITGQGGGILMGQASSLLGDSGFTFYYDGSFHDMSGLSPIAVNSLGEVLANGASTTNGFTVVHPATTNATPYLNRLRSTDSVAAWNKSHQMVGSGSFFYDNGTRYNLNDLLFGQSGWSNASPSFINDGAALSGTAQTNGASRAVVLLPCQIALLNGDTNTADRDGVFFDGTRPTTVDNSAISPDNTTAAQDITDVGTNILGDCPMGTGRTDPPFAGNSYISTELVIAKVQPNAVAAGFTYAWTRVKLWRSLDIQQSGGTQWNVTKDAVSTGSPALANDTDDGSHQTTAPSANNILYSYDASGDYMANHASAAVGDYSLDEKKFIYTLTISMGGHVVSTVNFTIGQFIVAKRISTTSGTVSGDWQGISCRASSVNIPDCQMPNDTAHTAIIRGIVGGSLPIVIDSHANDN